MQREGLGAAMHDTVRWLARKFRIPYAVEPYDYVQNYVEKHLHRCIQMPRDAVRQIVIVGVYMGHEVHVLLRNYPAAQFRLFEASPRYSTALKRRFQREPRVQIHCVAVSDHSGSLTFHETNLAGSGSLLKVAEMAQQSYGMQQAESYTVPSIRLDDHASENGYAEDMIDCLWIDVQGAEMAVLRGAQVLLPRVRSVFLEVSAYQPLYQGGATLSDLQALLVTAGFTLVELGTDPANGTGNAMFVRKPQSASIA
jgi:FkbM family methyltransferase